VAGGVAIVLPGILSYHAISSGGIAGWAIGVGLIVFAPLAAYIAFMMASHDK